MKIAIIGAGFAGLALCYYLLQFPTAQITVFDSFDCKNSASSNSSGLLHSYAGAHCRRTWLAQEGMQKTGELITAVEKILNKQVANRSGILRPALNSTQLEIFKNAATIYDDVIWLSQEKCVEKIPYLNSLGGVFIANGMSIDSSEYVRGLRLACSLQGALFETKTIVDLEEIPEYDVVVGCGGAFTGHLEAFKNLPLSIVKGQLIELAWPKNLTPLPCSLISNGYVTMSPPKEISELSCFVGATYERNYKNEGCDVEVAEKELRPKIEALLPPLKDALLLSCRAGIRTFSPNNISPIVGRLKSTSRQALWTCTAFGSKGLLYHAYFAELLAHSIIKNDPNILPREVRFRLN